jgi:tetratricopeptide (TPR) repeat protein
MFMTLSPRLHAEGEAPSLFSQGLVKYQHQEYAGAEQLWSEALRMAPTDTSLLFNQALCLLQQNKWGLAWAHLRELQLLSPRFPGLAQSLEYLQSKARLRSPLADDSLLGLYENLLGKYFLLPEALTLHWIFSLAALFFLGRLYRARRRAQLKELPRPPWQISHGVLAASWGILTLILVLEILSHIPQRATIITGEPVMVRSAPFNESVELTDLPPGGVVTITDYYKEWVQVQSPEKPTGWLTRQSLLLLTPSGLR